MTDPNERTPSLAEAVAELEQRHRQYEAVVAATLRRRDVTYAEIGRRLGVDGKTAKARAIVGEEMLAGDSVGALRLADDYLHGRLPDDPAERVVAALRSADPAGGMEAAARLFETGGTP